MSNNSFNFSSNLEWEHKKYTAEDIIVAQNFRKGELGIDLFNHDKYSSEGLMGTLILKGSMIQFGLGWFRHIPLIDINANSSRNSHETLLEQQMKPQDDMGLVLISSILNAARNTTSNYQQGQLIKFFSKGEVPKRNRDSASFQESSFNDLTSVKHTKANNSSTEQVLAPEIKFNLEDDPAFQHLTFDNSFRSDISGFSNLSTKNTPKNNAKYLLPLTNHDKTITYSDADEPWNTIECRICPTGVPINFNSFVNEDFWLKFDPTIKSDKTNFYNIIRDLFIAMRTQSDVPYVECDLDRSSLEIGTEQITLLTKIFTMYPTLDNQEAIVGSNQALWVLGMAYTYAKPNELNRLKIKYNKNLKEAPKLPLELFHISQQVAKLWGNKAPISRMQNFNRSFMSVIKEIGINSATQISKAISHLEEKFPHSC